MERPPPLSAEAVPVPGDSDGLEDRGTVRAADDPSSPTASKRSRDYDAVSFVPVDAAATLDKSLVLPLRPVRTDTNEATRGDPQPLIAKTRLVRPGYSDPQALEHPLQTDAPTLSGEGTALIYAEAAGNN